MYLRRTSKMKMEVSFDEPLNVDWDGNELLLSDILGTEEDVIYQGYGDRGGDKSLLKAALRELSRRERRIIELRFGLDQPGEESIHRRKWRIRWEFPSPIFLDLRKKS